MSSIKAQMEHYWAMSDDELQAMSEEEYEDYIEVAIEYEQWYLQEGWAEEDE